MAESEKAGMGFISSTALLARTGISRATLNNYIKMGMIPPPIVKKPDDPSIKAKQIGYFQDSVWGTIEKIKLYKKEGRSMKEIGSLFSLKTMTGSSVDDPEIPERTNSGSPEEIQEHLSPSGEEITGWKPCGEKKTAAHPGFFFRFWLRIFRTPSGFVPNCPPKNISA